MAIAEQILTKLNEGAPPGQDTGDYKVAKRNLDAWKQARGDGRFVVLDPPEIDNDHYFRGGTWPDLPADPNDNPAALSLNETDGEGVFREGQTPIQFTCLHETRALTLCECAIAVIILHEGHRLNQRRSPETTDPRIAQAIRDDMDIAYEDLKNIQAARAVCNPNTPECVRNLNDLENDARNALDRANRRAAAFNRTVPNMPIAPTQAP